MVISKVINIISACSQVYSAKLMYQVIRTFILQTCTNIFYSYIFRVEKTGLNDFRICRKYWLLQCFVRALPFTYVLNF